MRPQMVVCLFELSLSGFSLFIYCFNWLVWRSLEADVKIELGLF